jgi:hypothetical protein
MVSIAINKNPSGTPEAPLSPRGTKQRHPSDVTVFENQTSALVCPADGNIHHDPGQVVGANHK